MKLRSLALLPMLLVGCTDTTNYYFDGTAFDGKTGAAITGYKIEMQFLDRTENGTVDKTGRYFVGPLTPFNDYTVSITADGYRAFSSYNAMKLDDEQSMNANPKDDNTHPDRSQDFNAYLYQTSDTTTDVTLNVLDELGPTSGTISLTPASTSSPFADANVGSQVWSNDDDLRSTAIQEVFNGGAISFKAGELTYGVTYDVVIDSPGDSELTTTYTAGVEGNATFVLSTMDKADSLIVSTVKP